MQCYWDILELHRTPDQDKTLTEDEWMNMFIVYSDLMKGEGDSGGRNTDRSKLKYQ